MKALQVDGFVDADNLRSAFEVWIGKIFSFEAGLAVVGRERGGWNEFFWPQKVHARSIGHLGRSELPADAIERGSGA